MERNRILRKDWQEGQGGGVSLCVSDQLDWGWMRSQPRADGSGLKEGEGQVTLQWGSAAGHPTRNEQMRPTLD